MNKLKEKYIPRENNIFTTRNLFKYFFSSSFRQNIDDRYQKKNSRKFFKGKDIFDIIYTSTKA
jgi:hypothetical protein